MQAVDRSTYFAEKCLLDNPEKQELCKQLCSMDCILYVVIFQLQLLGYNDSLSSTMKIGKLRPRFVCSKLPFFSWLPFYFEVLKWKLK